MDSAVFRRDMEVGRQEGHQLQTELVLTREKQNQRHEKNDSTGVHGWYTSKVKVSVIFYYIYLHGARHALEGHISQPSCYQSNITVVI